VEQAGPVFIKPVIDVERSRMTNKVYGMTTTLLPR